MELIQMSINKWRDEQTVVNPYNGLSFSHKKQWSTDTFYNLDEPWKHYAKQKKKDTKGHILCNSLYMKHLK